VNPKLQEWLNTLEPSDRAKVVGLLGDLAVETQEDKVLNAAWIAAGLPGKAPKKYHSTGGSDAGDPTDDQIISAARAAAGLPPEAPKE
jgi:hypothetical protein